MGYEKVKSQFNGIAELEKRLIENQIETLQLLDNYSNTVSTNSMNIEIEDYFINDIKLCLNAKFTTDSGILNPTDLSEINATSTYVFTPNGTSVAATKDTTWQDKYLSSQGTITEAKTQALHDSIQETYTSVTYVSGYGISPKYNCHSYAWHSTSSSNKY